jgi:hypothetical protein
VQLTTPDAFPLLDSASVSWSTLDGTAVAGEDYTTSSNTLTFPATSQSGSSQTVQIPIVDSPLYEGPQTFTVRLSNPVNARLGTADHVVTINDDTDPQPLAVMDTPVPGTAFTPLSIAGWAINARSTAPGVTGIGGVRFSAHPSQGAPISLGNAAYGSPRTDVAQVYGAQFLNSGYTLTVPNLPFGAYDLVGEVYLVAIDLWVPMAPVPIVIADPTVASIDLPELASPPKEVGQVFTVAGWAIDRRSAAGAGWIRSR